jgi:PKD repeat protein
VGRPIRIRTSAEDRGPAGLDYVELDFGDGSRRTRRRSVTHRYKKAGRYTVVARAADKAGNVTVKRLSLRVVR